MTNDMAFRSSSSLAEHERKVEAILDLPVSREAQNAVRSYFHGLVRKLSLPGNAPGDMARLGSLIEKLRLRHDELNKSLRPVRAKATGDVRMRFLQNEYRRINSKLKGDIVKLEKLDPALGASLKKVSEAW